MILQAAESETRSDRRSRHVCRLAPTRHAVHALRDARGEYCHTGYSIAAGGVPSAANRTFKQPFPHAGAVLPVLRAFKRALTESSGLRANRPVVGDEFHRVVGWQRFGAIAVGERDKSRRDRQKVRGKKSKISDSQTVRAA